jgi:hypothetical protein
VNAGAAGAGKGRRASAGATLSGIWRGGGAQADGLMADNSSKIAMKPSTPTPTPAMRALRLCALVLLSLLYAGCDQLGIDSPEKIAAYKEAEGKAIGGGCRQSGRSIEDCYAMNVHSSKAAIFAGWREMDEYMRENKMDVVASTVAPATDASTDANASADEAASAPEGSDTASAPANGASAADTSGKAGAPRHAGKAAPTRKS